jgi:hypothetical protein
MSTSRPRRALRLSVPACILVLALTANASASQEPNTIRLTSEGQAAAKAVVLTRADFSFTTGWTGGAVKPDPSSNSTASCSAASSEPFPTVTNGDQQSTFNHTGAQVSSEITILKTSAMVRGGWKRTVGPQLLACLRAGLAGLAKLHKPNERLLSVKLRSFPHVATYTQAARSLWVVTLDGKTIPCAVDFILFARGRTLANMTIVSFAPPSPLLNAFESRLARAMASRMTV